MTVFLIQRPANLLVQVFDRVLGLLGNMSHNRMYHLALVVSLFALDNIFW